MRLVAGKQFWKEIMGNKDIENVEELDAVAAAPGHHRVIFENEYVRVLDTRVGPGETVPVHTHQWPSVVYTLSTGDFVRYYPDGNVTLDSRTAQIQTTPGDVTRLPPLQPHSINNVGDEEIRAISVELKHTRPGV
jgi:quercetin dioxygenase-like cupin family protein